MVGAFRSLRSKRFRVVSEQRKTKERRGAGFSGLVAGKKNRALTNVPCSDTARKRRRKRLLSRLGVPSSVYNVFLMEGR